MKLEGREEEDMPTKKELKKRNLKLRRRLGSLAWDMSRDDPDFFLNYPDLASYPKPRLIMPGSKKYNKTVGRKS
jgi:hypothetical protein